jgi:hypothetical protein
MFALQARVQALEHTVQVLQETQKGKGKTRESSEGRPLETKGKGKMQESSEGRPLETKKGGSDSEGRRKGEPRTGRQFHATEGGDSWEGRDSWHRGQWQN